jgi:hypothetical protein
MVSIRRVASARPRQLDCMLLVPSVLFFPIDEVTYTSPERSTALLLVCT